MKIIEIEVCVVFIGTIFFLISIAGYFFGKVYLPLLYLSVLCLIAAKWIELIDRAEIEAE